MDKSVFTNLNEVNVSDKTEKKKSENGRELSYLSWAWAWAEVKKRYPDATYEIIKFDGIPYVYDEDTGFMVYTTVTIAGTTHEMWLPVMDHHNCAMRKVPYEVKTKFKTFTVAAATMVDINKTLMRCLTKNLAMFGLGLYLYAGEDIPEEEKDMQKAEKKASAKKAAPVTEVPAATEQPIPFDISATQPISMLAPNQCTICHQVITPHPTDPKYTVEYIIQGSTAKYGAPICLACLAKKAKEASKNA